jgi:hypothetical protein
MENDREALTRTEDATDAGENTAAERENANGFTAAEQELWNKANGNEYNAVRRMRDERRLREAQATWQASEAGQRLKRLTDAYNEYHHYLEQHPHSRDLATQFDEGSQRIYQRMRANLERANEAPRCAWVKVNGIRCRAPKVRGKKLCHMHLGMEEARPQKMKLPALDDANGIQIAIAKGAQAMLDGMLDRQEAGLLGYYLQLALSNVGRVDFEDEWEVEEE